jgi:hypothetical protein
LTERAATPPKDWLAPDAMKALRETRGNLPVSFFSVCVQALQETVFF